MKTGLWLLGVCCILCSANALAEAEQRYADFEACQLTSGEVIAPCKIGYRTHGTLNADKSNAVLIPTWYTGTSASHAFLADPARIDPEQYFVVIVDAIGNGVSVSPSNSDTQSNEQFPAITIADMVDSQHRLLTEVLGIESLHAIVGLSMGGMQAFEWGVRYPEFAGKTISAIGSPRLPTFDIALWTTHINLLTLFRECQCVEPLAASAGMRMTQLVPEQLAQEVDRTEAVSMIAERGKAQLASFSIGNAWDQQRQAEAMISHNIARDFDDDLRVAAEQIESDFMIVVGADDRVVTPQAAIDFAPLIDAQLIVLDADCGHGDTWCAEDEFSSLIRGFLSGP